MLFKKVLILNIGVFYMNSNDKRVYITAIHKTPARLLYMAAYIYTRYKNITLRRWCSGVVP